MTLKDGTIKRGPSPKCDCKECKVCQDREAQRRHYLKRKLLGLRRGQKLSDAK